MKSRYDTAEAERFRERYPSLGSDVTDRVYTSRLLGQDPGLVLHGGGNTSVKTRGTEFDGRVVDVLWVKGSGWDLERIEPAGFSQCRLEPLRGYCRLPELSDPAMVAALRSQMLDPSGPVPSVEALLHAHLPGKFIDHTHAGAVLAIVDQPDAEARVRALWGARANYLPYVMPGFVLAQRVVELGIDEASAPLLILEKHGIFTWGPTARESYERMIDAVTEAEAYVARERRTALVSMSPPADGPRRRAARLAIEPALRGALTRRSPGARFVLEWRDGITALEFSAREASPEISRRGCVTPDHVIRTKPFPLWLDPVALAAADSASAHQTLARALESYEQRYSDYFRAHSARSATPLRQLDPLPRIVIAPGLGIVALGKSRAQARIAADLYEHSIEVMTAAESMGAYRPVSEGDLFDVEYWSLEQAKLGGARAELPLAGQVALVTGAASGIGLATAAHFLALGAHVMLVDRDAPALQSAASGLARFAPNLETYVADLTEPAHAREAVEATVLAFGGLDCVVSNAGSAPSGALHESEGAALLASSLDVNLLSHQHLAQSAADVLLRQGTGGCLLFNASKSAFNPGPLFGPYAVAKAALVALMKQYAIDLAPFGVRCNAINADRVRTGLFSPQLVEQRARARGVTAEAYFRANLLGRETLAQDVAEAFAYLAMAHATTGAVLPVDGGNAAAFPR